MWSHPSTLRTHSLYYTGHHCYSQLQQLTVTLLYFFLPEFEEHTLLPETKENMVCALGLFVGLVGIIAGVVFITKGMQRRNAAERRRGAL